MTRKLNKHAEQTFQIGLYRIGQSIEIEHTVPENDVSDSEMRDCHISWSANKEDEMSYGAPQDRHIPHSKASIIVRSAGAYKPNGWMYFARWKMSPSPISIFNTFFSHHHTAHTALQTLPNGTLEPWACRCFSFRMNILF